LLILGRRINQTIVFPNCGITVRFLDVNGRVAKIGIEAPRHVEIMRGELALAAGNRESGTNSTICNEQINAPEYELPVLQFKQRLADIKAGLHVFQQHRAAGDELGADRVLGQMLNDIAVLDSDWLSGLTDPLNPMVPSTPECVSEPQSIYQTQRSHDPIQVLIVNEPNNPNGIPLPFGTFHGFQVCSVNDRQTALHAISANETFDYIVCNGSLIEFDELDLVRTIRANHRFDETKIFMTTASANALEHLELSNSYRIDGWLARPLLAIDLWKHITESEQLES
jgi:carbon storage regulator CsrA